MTPIISYENKTAVVTGAAAILTGQADHSAMPTVDSLFNTSAT
jgi:hypothetical protein